MTRSYPLAETPTAPRRRVRAHRRVVVLTMTFVVVSAGVLALGLQRVGDVEHEARDAHQNLVPAASLLNEVAAAQQLTITEFQSAVSTTDQQAQTTHLTDAATYGERGNRAFDQYRKVAAGFSAERAAWERHEEIGLAQAEVGRQAALAMLEFPTNDVPEVRRPTDAFLLAAEEKQTIVLELEQAYLDRIDTAVGSVASGAGDSRRVVLVAFAVALALALAVSTVIFRTAILQERELGAEDRAKNETARHSAFEARIQRALEMSRSEGDSYTVIREALGEAVPDRYTELLVADSSRAHFRRVLGPNDGGGCGVTSPSDCPATRSGQAATFASSTDLDACPFLRDRPGGACSATCAPLNIAGQAIGVVHVVGPDRDPLDSSTALDLELVARRAGERIGLVRAFEASEVQAQTDPLTGLLNRRSLENRLRELVAENASYTLAYADLDRFKALNDTHGHETGDRALRLFARVLRDAVRPQDLPARYGGEEFVVALPDCNVDDAVKVMERVREQLGHALGSGSVPPFTASVGIAGAADHNSFRDVVAVADEALLMAKANGRDRIVVANGHRPDPNPPRLRVGAVVPAEAT